MQNSLKSHRTDAGSLRILSLCEEAAVRPKDSERIYHQPSLNQIAMDMSVMDKKLFKETLLGQPCNVTKSKKKTYYRSQLFHCLLRCFLEFEVYLYFQGFFPMSCFNKKSTGQTWWFATPCWTTANDSFNGKEL